MRKVIGLVALVLCAVLAVTAARSTPPPDDVVHVNGGGTGIFVDPSITPTDMGFFTNFGVGLTVHSDGTATGHFTCLIPGIVVVDGIYDAATYDSTTGIVTASGIALLVFPSFDPLIVEFTTTFREGGPGVGMFTLSDNSGFFPNYPTDVDTELVSKGQIKIH
jgi:hypothetical protein